MENENACGYEPIIIYEGPDFLVLNKPAGLQVHGARVNASRSPETTRATLVDWLIERYPEVGKVGDDPAQRPGIVHRLDKETSGVMVVARNQATFEYLKSLFQKHAIVKSYLALVQGIPKDRAGTIDAPIGIQSGTLKRSIRSKKMAKPAITEYAVKEAMRGVMADGIRTSFALLEARPKTGRTHQIRVHFASFGHPIVGDKLYGPKKQPSWAKRLMLHASSLEFTMPDGNRARFEAASPDDFSAILGKVRGLGV